MTAYCITSANSDSRVKKLKIDRVYESLDDARKAAAAECYARYYKGNYRQPPLFVFSYVCKLTPDGKEDAGVVVLSWEYKSNEFGGTSYFWMKKWGRTVPYYPLDKHTGKIGKRVE